MSNIDRAGIEKILQWIDEAALIDSRFRFYREDNKLCLLGMGSSSFVYEMYDPKNPERAYAAKVIISEDNGIDFERITHLARLQYSLAEQSENIVGIVAVWSLKVMMDDTGNPISFVRYDDDRYECLSGISIHFVIMEKLERIILKNKYGNVELLRDELKTEEGVIRFAKQIGNALFVSHDNGVLHRDIKLENIFWDDIGQTYKLGDFGMARYSESGNAETVIYTDGYGAPEIEKRLRDSYGVTADIYSYGISIYLLLNDMRFPASDSYNAREVQYENDFIVPAPIHASEKLASIIGKMCSFRPEDRYQSAEEVLIEIGGMYDDPLTETYSEVTVSETETYSQNSAKEIKIPLKVLRWYEKQESEWRRKDRLDRNKANDIYFNGTLFWRIPLATILFACLFMTLPGALSGSEIKLLILPVVLVIAALSQVFKELHITMWITCTAIALWSAYLSGLYAIPIIVLIVLTMGMPIVSTGCALGLGIYLMLVAIGSDQILVVFNKYNLLWIILLALFVFVLNEIYIKLYTNRQEESLGEKIWAYPLFFGWIPMMVFGVILLVLKYVIKAQIPVSLDKLHIWAIALGMMISIILLNNHYGLFIREISDGGSIDESMVK